MRRASTACVRPCLVSAAWGTRTGRAAPNAPGCRPATPRLPAGRLSCSLIPGSPPPPSPGFIALKLCPQLLFVRPNFDKYRAASEATRCARLSARPPPALASLPEAQLGNRGVNPPPSPNTHAHTCTRSAIFARYDPAFEAGSLDEAYLDVTEHCAAAGTCGEAVAAAIRAAVAAETQLTCSVGVAPNRMLVGA